jgi:gas vesicle protein
MHEQVQQPHDYRFLTGLMLGSAVGAGLALLLVPRATSEMRDRAAASARELANAASERYRDVRLRVTDAVDGLTRKGQGVRDGVCDSVVAGAKGVEMAAKDVERYATEAKTQKA